MDVEDNRGGEWKRGLEDRFQASRVSLVRRLERIVGHDGSAEEIAQETYVRALTRPPHDEEDIDKWLWRVAKNLAIDHLRKRWHEVSGFDELPAVPAKASQLDHLLQAEDSREVLEVLNELPEGQRICLKLSYFHGLSLKQIVELKNYSADQVRSHIQNGKIQFRRRWEARVEARKVHAGRRP